MTLYPSQTTSILIRSGSSNRPRNSQARTRDRPWPRRRAARSAGVAEFRHELVHQFGGLNLEGDMAEAGPLPVESRVLMPSLRHLHAQRGITVAGIEVIAIRENLEVKVGQQVLPERERLFGRREVDADVAKG